MGDMVPLRHGLQAHLITHSELAQQRRAQRRETASKRDDHHKPEDAQP
jgi:hypothetical protein